MLLLSVAMSCATAACVQDVEHVVEARLDGAARRAFGNAGATPTSVPSFATQMVADFVGTRGKQVFAALGPCRVDNRARAAMKPD